MNTAYRWIVDHLTKVLGLLGTAFMGLIALDPGSLRAAAQTYLGDAYAAKIGGALFVIVILRGWYTGNKAKQAAQELADAQAKANAAMAAQEKAAPAEAPKPPNSG